MPFELLAALRFLREGRFQTLLIVSGVTVGTAVIVFLISIITGLQRDLIDRTLGTQPHVVLRPPEEAARPLLPSGPEGAVAAEVEKRAQRLRSIEQWQAAMEVTARTPGVTAVSAMASGPATASRGNAEKSVALLGVEPERYLRIVPVDRKMAGGRFRLSGTEAVIGVDLARDLGAGVGDRLRLAATGGGAETVTVAGVFDLGVRDLNRRWVFVPLRTAQSLLGLAGGVTNIDATVEEIFDAESAAVTLSARTGLTAESWMRTNAELMAGLRGQSMSSAMIQFFVAVAVAFGISSVLVVSVVQKGREIGILRAMGATRGAILRIFLLQGAALGLAGSALGCGLGYWVTRVFQQAAAEGRPGGFPVWFAPELFVAVAASATLIGVLAAAAPAVRAARLDPAQAVRRD